MLVTSINDNINELIALLDQLEEIEFYEPKPILSGSRIGEHYRHVIELYICLLDGYDSGIINYDRRKRDYKIQTEPAIALQKLQYISGNIQKENKKITLRQDLANTKLEIISSYHRELLYNLEHSIHHQALIRIGAMDFNSIAIPKNFGVAKSTITFREKCAQ